MPSQGEDIDQIAALSVEVKSKDKAPASITTIKTEANFANFPFFALSRQEAARKTKTEYRVSAERDGQRLEVLWQVTSNAEFGYPGPFDRKVHKAVEYLITERGFPVQNPIPFTAYRILKLLNFSTRSGNNVTKIKETLRRVVLTGVTSEGTFYDKSGKQYISDTFHLYDRVIFRGKQFPDGTVADTNYLFLSQWYLASLNAHYVRPIDFHYLKSLKSDIAGRLYEMLGLKFYGVFLNQRSYWRVEYKELSSLLPITAQRYYAQACQKLTPAHQELVDTGFLKKVEWEQEKKVAWFIRYYPGIRARAEFGPMQEEIGTAKQLNLPLIENGERGRSRAGSRRDRAVKAIIEATEKSKTPWTEEEQALIAKLTACGVAANQVTGPEELIRDYGAEEVAKRVGLCDYLVKKGKEPLSPQLIVDSLKKNYLPDPYHEMAAEQNRRAEQETREQALLAEWQRRRAEAQTKVEEWASLPPEKRIDFGRLDFLETSFRLKRHRNPTEKEKAERVAKMVADLPSREEKLEHLLREIRSELEAKAREQGIRFPT